MFASIPDLLRLLAVPVLGWAAWHDVRVRRVPNATWYPLAALGVALLVWDGAGHVPPTSAADRLFLLQVVVSVGFLIPLSYAFWRLGGFGGADAKALMALALLFPTFPVYSLRELPVLAGLPWAALPVVRTALGVFSWTVLTNTVIVGVLYPFGLAVRNALAGEFSTLMFLGRRIPVSALSTAHGRLFEGADGFTRSGLDLDALRMYLRWRGTTLDALREDPAHYRDPSTIGETHDPTDGAVIRSPVADGGGAVDATVDDAADVEHDPWGAEAFLASIDGTAYGTTPEKLRGGLTVVTERDEVWISPGIPFLVPMFAGLVVGLTYGDLLFGLLGAAGLA